MATGRLWQKIVRWFAGGRTVADLAEWLQIEKRELYDVPRDYRVFTIPKRNGQPRAIHAPNDRLKAIQRTINRRLLRKLPTHAAATGFERGKSIVDNALPHARRAVVINIDVIEFFPSTRAERVHEMLRRCGWGHGAARLVTSLCTVDGGLPQGAPTSPKLSNLVNLSTDVQLSALAEMYDARYTRYADDITFSLPHDDKYDERSLLSEARGVLGRKGYTVHYRRKLSIRRRHQRQEVTGLVVNDRPRLSRETRRRLRAVEHRHETGKIATMTRQQLAGWRSLERMIAQQSDVS